MLRLCGHDYGDRKNVNSSDEYEMGTYIDWESFGADKMQYKKSAFGNDLYNWSWPEIKK